MPKRITITFEDDVYALVNQASTRELRTFANFINIAARTYAAQVLRRKEQLDLEDYAPGEHRQKGPRM